MLFHGNNRMLPDDFVRFIRYYLLLPLPATWRQHVVVDGTTERLEPCTGFHRQPGPHYIDNRGDHAASCPTVDLARKLLHNAIRDTYASAAKSAGASTSTEPARTTPGHHAPART